jgi:geranylgeranyl reductase family protein
MDEISLEDVSEEYDVIIVGAGPAGCTVARNLPDEYKVLMLEKFSIPRNKPCGGILVEESQNFIKTLEPPSYIYASPKKLNLEYIDIDNKIHAKTKRELINIFRPLFDLWLFRTLKKNNHDFVSNVDIADFTQRQNMIELIVRGGVQKKIRTRYLIGADGALSFVRNKLNHPIRKYVAIQKYFKIDASLHNTIIFLFDNEVTDFYSWIVPKQVSLAIGSAVSLQDSVRKFEIFEKKISKMMKLGKNIAVEAQVSMRPQSQNELLLSEGNIFLVGEAAGLITPSFGEGISYALRSGNNIVKALNSDFDNPTPIYLELCRPLINEINDKIKKAEILSQPGPRNEFLKKLEQVD